MHARDRSTNAADAVPSARLHGIDRLKGVAIVVIVWIHAFQAEDFDKHRVMQWSAVLTLWAVPAFFLSSGWLHARNTAYPRGTVLRWAERIGVPYLLATVGLYVFERGVHGIRPSWSELPVDLLLGRRIYYFVPVLVGALLFSLPLARSRRLAVAVWGALAPFIVLSPYRDPVLMLAGDPWHLMLRSPFHWWPYFFTGWVAGLLPPGLVVRTRPLVLGCALTIAIVTALVLCATVITWPAVYWPPFAWVASGMMTLAVSATLVCWSERPASPVVRWFSDATMPIFLYHLWFVLLFGRLLHPRGDAAYLVQFVLTLLATITMIVTTRAIFGRQRARSLIG